MDTVKQSQKTDLMVTCFSLLADSFLKHKTSYKIKIHKKCSFGRNSLTLQICLMLSQAYLTMQQKYANETSELGIKVVANVVQTKLWHRM